MSRLRIPLLTSIAMLAFAGNSLLCRIALKETGIDAASFTTVRILSGSVALLVIAGMQGSLRKMTGDWLTACGLFLYAACFSFAYVSLPTGTGALLLFGAVQASMLGYGLWRGERMVLRRAVGLLGAFAGIVGLVLPGLSAPPLAGAALMIVSGVAWGFFSIRGKGSGDPVLVITGSFVRAAPLAILLSIAMRASASWTPAGIGYAVLSGALTSGVGYIVWYGVLRSLTVTTAATVQLTVPMIAAAGGVLLLGEPVSLRLVLASIAIVGGVAFALAGKQQ
jgi:drug/metabolite transporter (DMT)-like permease